MSVIKYNSRTVWRVMGKLVDRSETSREKVTDSKLFVKLAYKYAELKIFESQSKGKASPRRNEQNRNRLLKSSGKAST